MTNSDLEEIPPERLQHLGPARLLEDVTTGDFYSPRRDGLVDLDYVTNAVAYYLTAGGQILLERPSGVKNRAELEQRQAEREQRRQSAMRRRPRTERR